MVAVADGPLTGKTFVVTGTLTKPRADVQKAIEAENSQAKERLDAIRRNDDGFAIAEIDFRLRGHPVQAAAARPRGRGLHRPGDAGDAA